MKIKDLLQERLGLTKTMFCKEAKISRPTIDAILKDKQQPRLQTIKKICNYFNVDPKDYLD